jgi:uroporphyrin-III C-methyltransferase/precorrin-2 dehydrogenase/sirohydrochlorin ferrochelatase
VRYFPLFLDISRRRVLIVGTGDAAIQKMRLACNAGAAVVLINTGRSVPVDEILAQAASVRSEFNVEDLRGCALVFVCGADEPTARRVSAAARAMGVPINVQDRAELSTFIMPAILDRAPVTVAVSSGGASPMLARVIRDQVAAVLPPGIGRLATVLERFRSQVRARIPSFDLRRRFWDAVGVNVIDGLVNGDEATLCRKVQRLIEGFPASVEGCVYIVGAGPGDPGLLTVRALRALQIADVILYDRLVDDRVMACATARARKKCVGARSGAGLSKQSEISRLMADLALAGCCVVRLKSGDPFVFGRSAEELDYLMRLGIRVEIVPGIQPRWDVQLMRGSH